ncbi:MULTISPECIES: PD-(D/E)XK motif protein [unclassified Carboxylicivirga]|uniref:PD-(D/E)XK motif protein n=1 Tax=Carboxylicivirga TaxID=1628153 RepID=UPI003D33A9DD
MEISNLKELWSKQVSGSEVGVVKEKVKSIPQFNCYIGTILASKAKLFSIELPENIKVNQNYLKRFTGVEIQFLPTKELIIILQENELFDVFVMFVEDIIKSISITHVHEEALIRISQRVSYWKRLFGKFTGGLLTPQQQRGLYGELLILEHLLNECKNHTMVMDSWQAPTATNQDFYFNTSAIEVKTSKSNHPSIKIANEFQLDCTSFEHLYVAFIKLSELPEGENTLLNKINEIRNILRLSPILVDDFNLKLSFLGINSDVESEYNKTSYKIRKTTFYKVTDEFPKIISSMVDKAVTHISYEVSPNECDEFEVSSETVLKGILNEE